MNKQILKTLLTLIIIFTCILHFTCKPPDIHEETEYDEYTDVVYSPELNTVTIYLNGRAPVPRALSRPLALMGCDYFEVNFLGSGGIVTRAEWMAGKIAGISDLPAGSYGNTKGAGSAILFAGKSDRTLMAVGRLTAVNGVAATAITAASITVTFTLNAVVAAVSADPTNPSAPSSFLTAARDAAGGYKAVSASNTVVTSENIFYTVPSKTFPCFELERLRNVDASYEFKLYSADRAFSDYGIYVSPPAFAAPGLPVNPVERKAPRYTSGEKSHESILLLDENTEVNLTNNNTAGDLFNSIVTFTFDTTNTKEGSVFSFAFSVPVYALGKDKDENISRWYVRSSYGPNLYDLDDGTSGLGGGVLIKTGHIPPPSYGGDFSLKLVTRPTKWRYNLVTTSNNRRFDVTGLHVDLYKGTTLIYDNIPYDELEYIIGKTEVNAYWSTTPPAQTQPPHYVFEEAFFGIIEVTVSYTVPPALGGSGQILKVKFYVLVSGMNYDLAENFRFVHIYTGNDNPSPNSTIQSWYDANHTGKSINETTCHDKIEKTIDTPESGNTIVIILHESFDFQKIINLNPSAPAPTLFIFIAGARLNGSTVVDDNTTPVTYTRYYDGDGPFTLTSTDVVIGRQLDSGTQGSHIIQKVTSPAGMSGIYSYYFGDWPFAGKVPGVPENTYPFRINTRGHFSDWVSSMDADSPGTAPNNFWNKLITDGFKWDVNEDGGVFNVKVGLGMMEPPVDERNDTIVEKRGKAKVQPYDEVDGYNPDEKIPVYPFLH